MINQMQHAAATANMYASAGMYDPVTLNPYANGTLKITFFVESIVVECTIQTIRSKWKGPFRGV